MITAVKKRMSVSFFIISAEREMCAHRAKGGLVKSNRKVSERLVRHDLFSLFISVSGPSASGKSTVAFIIEKALRDAGAMVTVNTDDSNPDAYRETLLSRKDIVKGKHIVIRENRGPHLLRQ